MAEKELEYLVNHIFLPPGLPQSADDALRLDNTLTRTAAETLLTFKHHVPTQHHDTIDVAHGMLRGMLRLHNTTATSAPMSQKAIERALQRVATGSLPMIALQIEAQNAGILIRIDGDMALFEPFELSPTNHAVMSTKGRLRRSFPASAVAIPLEAFRKPGFRTDLAHQLAKMNQQSVTAMLMKVRKTKQAIAEDRDTTHPGMVSEFLMANLKATGSPVQVQTIVKNTREEVLWKEARSPWRRSPTWLLIRVVLQLHFSRAAVDGSNLYKSFMLFVLAGLLGKALRAAQPTTVCERLFCMKAKITRRLHKLSSTSTLDKFPSLLKQVQLTIHTCAAELNQRWSRVRAQSARSLELESVANLNFYSDSMVTLPELDNYLESLQCRAENIRINHFSPDPKLISYNNYDLPDPTNIRAQSEYAAANLQGLEQWITSRLRDWVSENAEDTKICEKLQVLLKAYHRTAKGCYKDNPEALSIMVLTIMEIWVVCDEVACISCSPLDQYRPGIPMDVLQSLLLPRKSQLVRLQQVEYYHRQRENSRYATALLFDSKDPDAFPAQYIDQSPKHQKLLQGIKDMAVTHKDWKLDELRERKAEYERLKCLAAGKCCDYDTVIIVADVDPPLTEPRHRSDCQKCGIEGKMYAMSIEVYEDPLPMEFDVNKSTQAKAIVFELDVPRAFAHWREVRACILSEVMRYQTSGKKPAQYYALADDHHLRKEYVKRPPGLRIELVTESKTNVRSHRNIEKVALATAASICRANGSDYQYYDSSSGLYIAEMTPTTNLARDCMYKVPEVAKCVQKYLVRPSTSPDGPAPNTVIASQGECPHDMGAEEYRALCSMPLGHQIQWANILAELCMPSIDFKKVETTLVILQCIHQSGPPCTSAARSAHEAVAEPQFAYAIVAFLHTALDRVKFNWECSQALGTFVAIAARVLTLTDDHGVLNACLKFLSAARSVAVEWMGHLREKAYEASEYDRRMLFMSKNMEVSLVCASTFDMEDEHLTAALSEDGNISILVQCAISFQEGKQFADTSAGAWLALISHRVRRILHRSLQLVSCTPSGIEDAVQQTWSAYRPGHGWESLSGSLRYWFVTETVLADDTPPMSVHFNLLTGELLACGQPVKRPSAGYEQQELYSTLFGQNNVEVMPSNVSRMEFSTKRTIQGFAVNMGMRPATTNAQSKLLVQAVQGTRVYETLPQDLLQKAFPDHFLDDFVHWYDLSNRSVEFRPITTPWPAESSMSWTLVREKRSAKWRLTKSSSQYALGRASMSSRVLSQFLEPLTSDKRMHLISDRFGTLLTVEIPLLQLSFTLSKGSAKIWSKEYRGMRIDRDQSVGTLVGFHNKLFLKSDTSRARMMLLPEADVTHHKRGLHMSVSIQNTDHVVKVHPVKIDVNLGRLVDNGSQTCKLQLAYLHALTAYCIPDPLTGKTGTEQALEILDSASLRSFDSLSQRSIDMLDSMARLSPGRRYYPKDLQNMQTIAWDPQLPYLSQHGAFHDLVQSVFAQAMQYSIFFPDSDIKYPAGDRIDDTLHERDLIRGSTFRVSGYGAEQHSSMHDCTYRSRDTAQSSARAAKAFSIRSLVEQQVPALRVPRRKRGFLWDLVSEFTTVFGPDQPVLKSVFQYDGDYIADGSTLALVNLPGIHKSLTDPATAGSMAFRIKTWLATLAASEKIDLALIQILVNMYVNPNATVTSITKYNQFAPVMGKEPSHAVLKSLLEKHVRQIEHCPEHRGRFPAKKKEALGQYDNRRKQVYEINKCAAMEHFIAALLTQWPCETPVTPDVITPVSAIVYINVDATMAELQESWPYWHQNSLLYKWLLEIEDSVCGLNVVETPIPTLPLCSPDPLSCAPGYERIANLFDAAAPKLPALHQFEIHESAFQSAEEDTLTALENMFAENDSANSTSRLAHFVQDVESTANSSKFERYYINELKSSQQSLEQKASLELTNETVTEQRLLQYLERCDDLVQQMYRLFTTAIVRWSVVRETHHRPRVSPAFFLQQLARHKWQALPHDWKSAIVHFGIAITFLHRAQRMYEAFMVTGTVTPDLVGEIRNTGHVNWDPHDYPETLLIEVESGIMIREVQAEIAEQMRFPANDENSAMQLNMGEGKSSVIVPTVAASLANGERLVRAIVAKPQSKQMKEMLISKLGGLVGRRIYYMPFSRSLKLNVAAADAVAAICKECMEHGGILLLQPEHILSFKLMGPECYIRDKNQVGRSLIKTQDFFNDHARDIVDESDENFSVHFELIYTMGKQQPVGMSPDRWSVIQEVLGMIKNLAPTIARDLGDSVEVHDNVPGSFPRTRTLREDAESRLVHELAKQICDHGVSGFPISRQPKAIRDAVYVYMTHFELSKGEMSQVEDPGRNRFWSESTKDILFLLRGLLAGGVIGFVLSKKRWRVNYGTTTDRSPPTKLAVPFRAKDNPSPRSEYSHPDVVIILTSLCYYYSGLSNDDLFASLQHLIMSDQAAVEYQAWVMDANNLPIAFRHLQGINLEDKPQCIKVLFPALRYGKSVVDYFLSHIVFPKEMKEYPQKLSASGWDIGKATRHPLTGFSGTCDSKSLLPLGVKHLDLPEQNHTNALVLEHLLQPENSVQLMPGTVHGSTSDADQLIDVVLSLKPEVQVILDVGAQILELDNLEMAKKWLEMHPDYSKEAVVYVNTDDEISVIDREGHPELLQTSSYAARLDACLIFLDEAHTRGIDLRLPTHYRAAVTLGARLTKDRLVQACMRLRKLGKGQSVVFCIPGEIQTKILARTRKVRAKDIEVADVLNWAMYETITEIRSSMSLYTVQGERFVRHDKRWTKACKDGVTRMSSERAVHFLESEAQSVEDRYRPQSGEGDTMLSRLLGSRDPDLQRIVERCRQFDDLGFNASALQEEQERELSPEIEQERQVQRPPSAKPAKHDLHGHVIQFASTGAIIPASRAYMPAFDSIADTTAATDYKFKVKQLASTKLLVTADFARTVERSGKLFNSDQYQRTVQWVLVRQYATVGLADCVMIVSPFEAQRILPYVRASKVTTLHLFKARSNLGYDALDKLDLYIVPRRAVLPELPRALSVQLQLFSGQLYLSSYEDYLELCKFLGLSADTARDGWQVAADGFIVKDGKGRRGGVSGLGQSPVQFLKVFLSKVRRNGEGITRTHLGRMLKGSLLQPKDLNVKAASVDDKAHDSVLDSDSE